jgi:hypothetical protein
MVIQKDGVTQLQVDPCKLIVLEPAVFFVSESKKFKSVKTLLLVIATDTTTVINLKATTITIGDLDIGKSANDTSTIVATLQSQVEALTANLAKLQTDYNNLLTRVNNVDTLAVCFFSNIFNLNAFIRFFKNCCKNFLIILKRFYFRISFIN